MRKGIAIAALLVLLANSAWAKVATIPLKVMVAESDLIVVAKVTSVERTLFGKRVATAEVLEIWKGQAEKVEFLASPTWTCDVSDAKEGETVVLFLTRRFAWSDEIAHSGRGRMPVRQTAQGPVADFWPEVRLPEGTPTLEGPDPETSFIRSVEIDVLRDLAMHPL